MKNFLRIVVSGATGIILQTALGLTGVEGFTVFLIGFLSVTLIWREFDDKK